MFGIGGGELIFIMFIALMLFGSDKIPDIARTMGKAMAQLKHATNDLKSEIQKGAEANGLDQTFRELGANFNDIKSNIDSEITRAKQHLLDEPVITSETQNVAPENLQAPHENGDITIPETQKKEIDDSTGPIKRQS